MPTASSSSARQQYEREGYAVFRDVIDPELIQEARRHVDWLVAKNPDLRPERLDTQLVPNDPFWVRLISDDRLLDIAQQFIGPDIALFASHYICKPPRDGQPVLWHQDGSFWPLDPVEVVTLWLAVDDSTPENGCMRVIPGSHTQELQPMQRRPDVESVLMAGMAEGAVDERGAVDVALRAGDVSVHHPNIIHGSEANDSEHRRCGLTVRYIPTSTRITRQPWPPAFLLRGRAVPGVNEYSPRPRYIDGQHMPFRGAESWAVA